jgi:hypothetical protein
MKRTCPALVESNFPYSAPRVSVFLDQASLIVDVLAKHSLLKVSSGKIEAGLGVYLAPHDFRRGVAFRDVPCRRSQHSRTMFGARGIYCKNAGPA